MVLKRRLPSKLTQESQGEEKQEPSQQEADFSADLRAEEPSVSGQEAKDFSSAPPAQADSSGESGAEEPAVEEGGSSMKRQVKRRRQRGGAAQPPPAFAEGGPQPQQEGEVPEGAAQQEQVDLPPAHTRPDAEAALSGSMASLTGAAEEEPPAPQAQGDVPAQPNERPDAPIFDLSTRAEEEEPESVPEAVSPSSAGGVFEQMAEPADESPETQPHSLEEDAFTPPPSLAEQQVPSIPAVEDTPTQGDGWEIGEFSSPPPNAEGEENPDQPPLPPVPMADVYRDVVLDDTGPGRKETTENQPPPELPGSKAAAIGGMGRASNGRLIKILVMVAVVLVVVVAVVLVRSGDQSRERLNRLGESMAQVQQEIPEEDFQALENQMEQEMAQLQAQDVPLAPPPVIDNAGGDASVEIDFLDVAPEEANEPIMAENEEELPEDIGAIAKLQREIARLKKEQGEEMGEAPAPQKGAKAVAVDVAVEDTVDEREKIEEELAAYRQALVEAENVEELPKPSDFLADPEKFERDGPRTVTTPAGDSGLPPSSLYENNPSDLPVIPEPEQPEGPTIRTLNDFDLALFEPERNRVRIPKGVRPRLSSTDFPQLEILSLIPDRGVIAVNRGQEGVLMIGESVEGWELLGVYQDYAEFRNGTRRHVVTRE